MWYNSVTKEKIDETNLYNFLNETSHENEDYFLPKVDRLIDDDYPPIEYYNITIFSSDIIRIIEPRLYDLIKRKVINDWINNALYYFDYNELNDGDTLDQYIDFYPAKEILSTIKWRNDVE